MQKPTLILVSGAPGAGKTTIAASLSASLRIPMVSKDAIKESLFDSLGWSDRGWSRNLGRASMTLLFDFVDVQLAAGRAVIAESNFYPDMEDGRRVRELRAAYDSHVFVVYCTAALDVVLSRFRARQGTDERHAGHVMGASDVRELEARVKGGFFHPIDLGSGLLTVDTTEFSRVDCDAIAATVRSALVLD
jgi:predicted kinase